MRVSAFVRTLSALALLATNTAFAKGPEKKPAFDNAKKQIELFNVKFFKGAKRVIIPFAKLRFQAAGKVHGRTSKGDNHAHATARYAVNNYDRAYLESIALELQDDLVAKFKAAGWEVLTYEDIKNDPEVTDLKRLENGKNAEFPTDTPGADILLLVTPTPEQNFKPAFQGMGWALRKLAKAREGIVVMPNYHVVAPQFWVEERKGFASNSISVKNAPGMSLVPRGFYMEFFNHKGAGGSMSNKDLYVGLSENAGTLSEVDDNSPAVANALSAGLAMLSGFGSVDRKSKLYAFELNQEAYKAGLMEAAKLFNDAAVAQTAAFASK